MIGHYRKNIKNRDRQQNKDLKNMVRPTGFGRKTADVDRKTTDADWKTIDVDPKTTEVGPKTNNVDPKTVQ